MPIYEYRCEACGHELEALQKISEAHLTDCPACGQPQLRRLVSAPRFRLKGAGWYETDFKKEGDRKRNLADGKEAPSKDAGGAGKEAAKTDTKTDTPKPESSKSTPSKSGGTGEAAA
ncbi:MAG: zinc ribbon domain-containing protein [Gammaproteobacteria bacterium]|nr:zinc ribbon domain-containing protein [Gammaproteobacteria bacterium]